MVQGYFAKSRDNDDHCISLWVPVTRLAWPRFKQSSAILISNFQIVANIGTVSAVAFPPAFTQAINAVGSIVNMDVLNLPGLACLVGQSYYRKFIGKMLLPMVLVGITTLASIVHRRRIRTRTMPMPPGLSLSKSWRFKVCAHLSIGTSSQHRLCRTHAAY